MREGAQQRLAALRARAKGHRDDPQAQDHRQRAHRPAALPPCEGRVAARAAVLQRVSAYSEEKHPLISVWRSEQMAAFLCCYKS